MHEKTRTNCGQACQDRKVYKTKQKIREPEEDTDIPQSKQSSNHPSSQKGKDLKAMGIGGHGAH